jgi:addiction module HigA family antidote
LAHMRSDWRNAGHPKDLLRPPPSPGEVLRDLIATLPGLTQENLAEAMGVTRYSVNQLVNDRRGVTAEMAVRLGKALSTSPEFWLNLQRNQDLFQAYRRLKGELHRIQVVRKSLSKKGAVSHEPW